VPWLRLALGHSVAIARRTSNFAARRDGHTAASTPTIAETTTAIDLEHPRTRRPSVPIARSRPISPGGDGLPDGTELGAVGNFNVQSVCRWYRRRPS